MTKNNSEQFDDVIESLLDSFEQEVFQKKIVENLNYNINNLFCFFPIALKYKIIPLFYNQTVLIFLMPFYSSLPKV